ncbi:MAG: flagellar motor protein MotB, partial [Desulfarculus sp.]|nr:flagellar motor protein MotB [Desulfarculus sp.]
MPRRLEGPSFDPLGWMLTFSDLVTLLLTFFVMLLAMRAPEVQKLKAAFGVFQRGGQGVLESTDRSRIPELLTKLDQVSQPRVDELKSADQEAARQLDLPGGEPQSLPSFLQPGVNLRRDERGLVITLSNDVLFAPGKADLGPEAAKRISQAAEILRYGSQPISVEGHTDNERLPGEVAFKDNYDLSLARALAVARQLTRVDGVEANRVRVAALGPSRPLA